MSRTLNKELHAWWQASSLDSLVPAANVSAVGVTTEESEKSDADGDNLRDIEVAIGSTVEQVGRTNEKTLWKASVDVEIYGPDPDEVETVGDRVSDEWGNKSYTGTARKIVLSQPGPREQPQQDDDGWLNIVRFEMRFEEC